MKSLLGPGCDLSLPTVTEGIGYRVTQPGTHELERVCLTGSAGLCVVNVAVAD
ncbi:hypothetical protein [Egibacter rhizosphaerae]|uniref:hypothetical protein n=1 Tax=Egibacter rhizosphaerae TaxID=1670831 RepID=UPI0013F1616F|nr:hypothetical protein [Egibacter rhizosphaerae]